MKKILALILLLFVVFLVVNRRRVYLRDPLAKVSRDGVAVSGVKVLINYPNDVLLDDQSVTGQRRLYLVQHWNQTPGTPTALLKCINGVACLTDADQASIAVIRPGIRGRLKPAAGVAMTDKSVTFVDENGARVSVTLR